MMETLREFKRRHGHCNVPDVDQDDPELARWVRSRREFHKKDILDKRQKRDLDRLGFVWDVRTAAWEAAFGRLQEFKRRFGHSNVPQQWAEDRGLGAWLLKQRQVWKAGKLDGERLARLQSLGVVFE